MSAPEVWLVHPCGCSEHATGWMMCGLHYANEDGPLEHLAQPNPPGSCPQCGFWGTTHNGRCGWCEAKPTHYAHGPLQLTRPLRRLRRFAGWRWQRCLRLVRIGKRVARDHRVPKWLRWTILGGIVAGPLLAGPIDELVVCALIFLVVRRYPVVWREHAAMVDLERAVSE